MDPLCETQIYPSLKVHSALILPGMELDAQETFISGLWMFAKGKQSNTGEEIYHELPWGIGLLAPLVFNSKTQKVSDLCRSPDWYKIAIESAYAKPVSYKPLIRIHKRRPATDVWFVNCVMPYYGDCVSMLLRTGILKNGSRDSIALVPSQLIRMVPDWYAEVWEISPPNEKGLKIAIEWNDELNKTLRQEFKRFSTVAIPHLFQPAAPVSSDVKDFLGLHPVGSREWVEIRPTVTFLWREERLSPPEFELSPKIVRILTRLRLFKHINRQIRKCNLWRYKRFIVQTSKELLRSMPLCKINVIGKGLSPKFPDWVGDFRVQDHSLEADRADELIVSQSHILVSAHGSHLVTLSALPGCVVQLIPHTKWGNWLDALSIRDRDEGGWVNYISVASDIGPRSLASLLVSRLCNGPMYRAAYGSKYSGLCPVSVVAEIRGYQ